MTVELKTSFIPNEMRTSILHITSYDDRNFAGYLENIYLENKLNFSNLTQMLFLLDDLADQLGCPLRSNEQRNMATSPLKNNDIPTLARPPGKALASFKVLILFRQHTSWQGICEWMETKKSANFRSALELVQLMDSVLSTV